MGLASAAKLYGLGVSERVLLGISSAVVLVIVAVTLLVDHEIRAGLMASPRTRFLQEPMSLLCLAGVLAAAGYVGSATAPVADGDERSSAARPVDTWTPPRRAVVRPVLVHAPRWTTKTSVRGRLVSSEKTCIANRKLALSVAGAQTLDTTVWTDDAGVWRARNLPLRGSVAVDVQPFMPPESRRPVGCTGAGRVLIARADPHPPKSKSERAPQTPSGGSSGAFAAAFDSGSVPTDTDPPPPRPTANDEPGTSSSGWGQGVDVPPQNNE